MKRINRYLIEDFITTDNEVILEGDEINISHKHDIVIGLEPEQINDLDNLKKFIVEISKNVPKFDNQVQNTFIT